MFEGKLRSKSAGYQHLFFEFKQGATHGAGEDGLEHGLYGKPALLP